MSGQALPLPPLRILPPSEIHSNWIHDNGWPSRPGHGARPGDGTPRGDGSHGPVRRTSLGLPASVCSVSVVVARAVSI